MFDTAPDLFEAMVSLGPLAPKDKAKAKARRDAIKAAGGAEYETLLAYERAARAKWRAQHPGKKESDRRAYKRSTKGFRHKLCEQARSRARKRGLDGTITPADLTWPTHCPVLGLELDYPKGPDERRPTVGVQPNWPSLDRWDSTKGYVPGNVFVISYRANTLKNNATYAEILKVAKYLSRRPR